MLRSRSTPNQHSSFRPDIEGMRGIAVLLVVLFHCGVPPFGGGFIGVDVFFALSGYLITGIVLAEISRTGKISFLNFYARRARRLLPAAGFVVICTLLLSVLIYSPIELARYAKWASYTSLYASNYMFIRAASNYFASDVTTNPFLHTWSLAVEEQFYLFWPALIAGTLLLMKSRRRLAIVLAILSALSLASCIYLTQHHLPWAFFSLPTRAWEFGLGGLACMLPTDFLAQRKQTLAALGWSGLIAIMLGACLYTSQTVFPGAAAMLPVLGTLAVLISGAAQRATALGALLGTPVLQFFGRLSYSWYLWHWPILLMAEVRFPEIAWPGKLLAAGVALLLSQLTFILLERPIRFNAFLVARPALSLGLVLLVATCGITAARLGEADAQHVLASVQQARLWAAANDPRLLFDAHCLTAASGTRLAQCVYGDRSSETTVVLFGDSHAEQWFPAVNQIALNKHWRLVTLLKSSCPAARVKVFNVSLKRDDSECSAWRESALERMAQLHPSLVILSESDAIVANHAHASRPHLVPAAAWGEGLGSTLSFLDAHGIKAIVIADVPRPDFDVPACLSRAASHDWARQDCSVTREAALNQDARLAERSAVASVHSARMLDFTDKLCAGQVCQPTMDGEVVFRDSNHLTSTFARSLAVSIEEDMDGLWLSGKSTSATLAQGSKAQGSATF